MSPRRIDVEESIEACIEALDETAIVLAQYPPSALAEALAVHLEAVLAHLHEQGVCSCNEIRQWLDEIVRGACGDDP